MKAGLLTFHAAHHYGAQLQAYALMEAVRRLGVDCEVIDYVREDTVQGNRLFKSMLSPRNLLSNVHTALNYSRLKRRYDRFEAFKNRKMTLSESSYRTNGELVENPPSYDVYICGSDQVWNPLIYKEKTFDPAFFAAFAREGRRIAYAPSFGIAEMPEAHRDALRKYVSSFEHLSVRERQGEKILADVTGRGSVTVLDPTLLLNGDEWGEAAAGPVFRMPYILCYFISDSSAYAGFVKEIAEKYRLPVVSLCGVRRVVPSTSHTVLDAGPAEFISLFRDAAFVCTNSFHGTVFSINFKKDFISFTESYNAEKAVNSRIYNILGTLGLKSRIVAAGNDPAEFRRLLDGPGGTVDYAAVERLLDEEREKSISYLRNALGSEGRPLKRG